MRKDFRGANNPRWNNGVKTHAHGYRLIASHDHPFKDKQGYVREHRLVMEKHIGRYLAKDELVHHLNHDKTDNRIENLMLTTRSEHKKSHHPEIGVATQFKKGRIALNKNGREITCTVCGKMFYVPKSLIGERKTCGDKKCRSIQVSKTLRENYIAKQTI